MDYDISIVIVNYNVRHFLQQTLESVQRAIQDLNVETWVVDNNSVDDSVTMVQREFPSVKLIANKDNPGFSKANNQAIREAKGKYILLLNPDTVLQEDTLTSCFSFMEKNKDAGAVGAKMIDGSGQFLPESKRGFPSPWVSFCKATGLSKLFPKSPTFNKYHLGYLDENETHKIDVLCGAFMFIRKSVLDTIGLLDEAFFMYGEDIDLSYRIKQAGYEIYYYPDTQLIHFKGESTKKSSVNYVRVFYQAMIIFAKKHFSGKGAGALVLMLNVAIFGRALVSIFRRFTQKVLPQLLDFIIIFIGLIILKEAWEMFYFKDPSYFDQRIYISLALYSLVYVFALLFYGVYRKNYTIGQVFRAIFSGLIFSLAVYGLLESAYRSSRMLLLASSLWAIIAAIANRGILRFIRYKDFHIGKDIAKRIFIIGSKKEIEHVETLLKKSLSNHKIVGKIGTDSQFDPAFHDTKWTKIDQLAKIEKANEFIFCMENLEWQKVMKLMSTIGPHVEYKMVGDDKLSILGSKSKNTSGELYSIGFQYNLSKWQERWKKRLLDIIVAVLFIALFPFCFWIQKEISQYKSSYNLLRYFTNLFSILSGKKSLVSYHPSGKNIDRLPALKEGLLSPVAAEITDEELIGRSNVLYAKDYTIWTDIEILFRNK